MVNKRLIIHTPFSRQVEEAAKKDYDPNSFLNLDYYRFKHTWLNAFKKCKLSITPKLVKVAEHSAAAQLLTRFHAMHSDFNGRSLARILEHHLNYLDSLTPKKKVLIYEYIPLYDPKNTTLAQFLSTPNALEEHMREMRSLKTKREKSKFESVSTRPSLTPQEMDLIHYFAFHHAISEIEPESKYKKIFDFVIRQHGLLSKTRQNFYEKKKEVREGIKQQADEKPLKVIPREKLKSKFKIRGSQKN